MYLYTRRVRYHECDRMGVTHHSNYIRFMEEARVEMMESLGVGYRRMEEMGIVSPVVSLSCEFRRPTTFMDDVEIRVCVSDATSVRLTLEYTMSVRGERVMTGRSAHCFLSGGAIVSIKERLPELWAAVGQQKPALV